MKVPNLRICANCGKCKHGDGGEEAYYDEYRVQCFKYCFQSSEWHICDDYEELLE